MPTATDRHLPVDDPEASSTAQLLRELHAPAVRQLALTEGRRLLRSKLLWLAAALSLLNGHGIGWFSMRIAPLDYADQGVGFVLVPLLAATMILTWLVATRHRREGTDELTDPTLLPPAAVTRARLLAVLAPVAASVPVIALWQLDLLLMFDGYGTPDVVDLLHGPALVALAGTLGTALGTWTPARLGPIVLLAAFAFPLTLAQRPGAIRELAWWREPSGWINHDLLWRPSAEHLAYLAGIAAIGAVAALLRHGVSVRRAVAGLAALALTVAGAVTQLQGPTEQELEERVALARDPMLRAECEDRDDITYCVWPEHRPLIDHWHPVLDGTAAALPEGSLDDLEVRVWLSIFDGGLTDTVAATGVDLWRGDDISGSEAQGVLGELLRAYEADRYGLYRQTGYEDALALEPQWARGSAEGESTFALGRQAAARAIGLPTEPIVVERTAEEHDVEAWIRLDDWPGRDEGRPMPSVGNTFDSPDGSCFTLGQARAVIAMWAAGTVTGATRAHVRTRGVAPGTVYMFEQAQDRAAFEADPFIHDGFGGPIVEGPTRITWGKAELDVAAQLLDLPVAEVRAVLAADWARWIDPATTTAELVEAFDLTMPPTAAERLAAAGLEWDPNAWPQEQGNGPRLRDDGTADPLTFGDPFAVPCA